MERHSVDLGACEQNLGADFGRRIHRSASAAEQLQADFRFLQFLHASSLV